MYAATRISVAHSRMITLIHRTTTVDIINADEASPQTSARARSARHLHAQTRASGAGRACAWLHIGRAFNLASVSAIRAFRQAAT